MGPMSPSQKSSGSNLTRIFFPPFLSFSPLARKQSLQSSTSTRLLKRHRFSLPAAMKAVVITSPGGPEVLKLQQVEDPEIGDDEVLVRVEASALNRADTLQRKGSYPPPKGSSEFPGLECSGTIEAVGKSVSRWKVGDQVNS